MIIVRVIGSVQFSLVKIRKLQEDPKMKYRYPKSACAYVGNFENKLLKASNGSNFVA